jgi:hypothetical protein
MIYCVWYPSGGFGHFVNAILSLHGNNFARPKKSVVFSKTGDSHQLDLLLPKYFRNRQYQLPPTDPNKNYSVLVDNGINDESTDFKKVFTDSAKIVKICYDDHSWPIIARTLINKAMQKDLDSELSLGSDWPVQDPWAIREKYFLYLRDHPLRNCWRSDPTVFSLSIDTLLNYPDLKNLLDTFGIECSNFENLHHSMLSGNLVYLSGVRHADNVISAINNNVHMPLDHITDLWDQAVVNYFIQHHFNFEVPANTYANWFSNTSEIIKLI